MDCFKNDRARENFAELVHIFGSKEQAKALIVANNGFALDQTRVGEDSELYNQILLITRDRNKALFFKSLIYKRAFDQEPSIHEFSGLTDKQLKVIGAPLTEKGMRSMLYADATELAVRIGGKKWNVKRSGLNTLTTSNPTATANMVNNYYGQTVAVVTDDHVTIGATREQLADLAAAEISRRYAEAEKFALEHALDQYKETNQDIAPLDEFEDEIGVNYDLDDALLSTDKETDFLKYKEYLESDINKLKERRKILTGKKRQYNDRDISRQITDDLVRITSEIERLEKQLTLLDSEASVQLHIEEMAQKDIERVRHLIRSNSGEDLLEAQDIIDWYERLGEFEGSRRNPFFKENIMYGNEQVKESLRKISREFRKLGGLLDKRIKEQTHKRLISHRNYDKLGLDVTVDKLFSDPHDDIDKISSWLLNPYFTYDLRKEKGDNLISQLMMELFIGTLSEKDGFARNKSAQIDVLLPYVQKKLKALGFSKSDYSFFYQNDEDGNITPYLITPYSSSWYGLRSKIGGKFERAKKRIQASRSTDYSRANRERFKDINKNAEFLKVNMLPEIRDAFSDQGFTFGTQTQMDDYSRRLKERFGIHEYERIVAEQIKLVDEYLQRKVLFEQKLLLDVESGQLSTLEKTRRMTKFNLQNNPFNVFEADNEGRIRKTIAGEDVRGVFNSTYNEFIPKTSDTMGHMNKDFERILQDDQLYRFWNVLSESLSYMNQVLASTGEESITFNSMMEMNQSIRKGILKKGLPFKQRMSTLFNHIVDKAVRKIRVQDDEFTRKQKLSETTVDTGKLKSLRARIMKIHGRNTFYVKKLLVYDKVVPKVEMVRANTPVWIVGRMREFLKDNLSKEQFEALDSKSSTSTVRYSEVKDALYKTVEQQMMDSQSLDLPMVIKYYLNQAARVDAANETIPVLRIMKKLYKELQTEDKKDRVNANKRLDRWYNRVVRGYFGGKAYATKTRVTTKAEREELKQLKAHLEYLRGVDSRNKLKTADLIATKKRIEEIGRPINKAFIVSAFQSWIIMWGMAYNLKAGAINYFHGYYQNKFHDAIGSYWTPGNADKAFGFVIGKGRKTLYRASRITGDAFGWATHKREIEKAELLINKLAIIQDVRNEKQKASRKLGKEDFKKKWNPYYLSITGVEWRNQSTTILSLLMDETIKDVDGNEYKIFNGKQFIIYDNVNADGVIKGEKDTNGNISKGGHLKLKPQFRIPQNIQNWEEMTGSDFTAFKINANNAVINVHGDYSNTGGMAIKDNVFGKAGMTFLTFLPMLLHSRMGAGINLSAGTKREKGVYMSANASTAGLTAGIIGGLIFGPIGGMVGAGLGFGATHVVKGPPNSRKQEAVMMRYFFELLGTLKAYAAATANVPLKLMFKKGFAVAPTYTIDDAFKGEKKKGRSTRLDEEDAKAIRGIMSELAMITNFMLLRALALKTLKCEEEEEWCEKRKAAMNWIANNLDRILDDLTMPMNPLSLFDTISQGAFLMKVEQLGTWAMALFTYDKYRDIYTTGKDVGKSKLTVKTDKFLMPSVVKNFGLFSLSKKDRPDYLKLMEETGNIFTNAATLDFKQSWESFEEAFGELNAPAESEKIFRTQDYMNKVLFQSDRERAEEIVNVLRTSRRQELREENEFRSAPRTESQITGVINKEMPTVDAIEKKMKAIHGERWKDFFNYEIEKILDEYD